MEYWTAFTIGLLGSFHCVGMCGPIALAIPIRQTDWLSRIIGTVIYNAGRVSTYALFGAIFGLLGKGIQLAGIQQWVSIGLGIVILLYFGLPYLSSKFGVKHNIINVGFVSKLKGAFGSLLQSKSTGSLFLLGLLNGLLPCGLVYLVIAGAIAAATPQQGSLYMAVFGMGTLPLMLVLPIVGNFISLNIRNKMRRVVPVFVIGFAALFIMRGMNLGIPYLSPQFSSDRTEVAACCHAP
jgi:uncharacterized protein